MKISSCCDYPVEFHFGDDNDDIGICTKCGEWAGVWDDEESEDCPS